MSVFLFESKMKDKDLTMKCGLRSGVNIRSLCVSHASMGAAIIHAAPHLYSLEFSLESTWHDACLRVSFSRGLLFFFFFYQRQVVK